MKTKFPLYERRGYLRLVTVPAGLSFVSFGFVSSVSGLAAEGTKQHEPHDNTAYPDTIFIEFGAADVTKPSKSI